MAYCSSRTCIWFCVYVTIVAGAAANGGSPKPTFELPPTVPLDKSECPGPVAHYKSLNCTPVYFQGQNCPVSYDCHLDNPDKCFVNGQEYEIGQRIRQNDANLCEKDCICQKKGNKPADFECTNRKKLCNNYTPSNTSCYYRNSLQQCCPEPSEICLNEPENVRHFCNMSGDIILDGDYIVPKFVSLDVICICRANKTDQTLVCVQSERWFWSDIHAAMGFYINCAPVYLPYKNNIGSQRQTWRCPNVADNVYCIKDLDEVAHRKPLPVPIDLIGACDGGVYNWLQTILNYFSTPIIDRCELLRWHERTRCEFGEHSMHVGDELNRIFYGTKYCIVCTCEVPPTPTCVLRNRLSCFY